MAFDLAQSGHQVVPYMMICSFASFAMRLFYTTFATLILSLKMPN